MSFAGSKLFPSVKVAHRVGGLFRRALSSTASAPKSSEKQGRNLLPLIGAFAGGFAVATVYEELITKGPRFGWPPVAIINEEEGLNDFFPGLQRLSTQPARAREAVEKDAASKDESNEKKRTGVQPSNYPIGRYTIADAIEKVSPAVVHIVTVRKIQPDIFHALEVHSSGSGFIINTDGTVITNAHVVEESASKKGIKVTLADGRSFPASLVASDTVSDIAILKIDAGEPLPVVPLGSSKHLRPGEWVVALGCPLALSNSVSAGIVSAVARGADEIGLSTSRMAYIQTDTPIEVGNSGGPLVDLDGKVIGINTMKVNGVAGIGFAIPIDPAIDVVHQLQKYGRVYRPYIGIKMLTLNKNTLNEIRESDRSFPDISHGVLVAQVTPKSPAEKAGLQVGDVIVQMDGQPVHTVRQVTDALGMDVGKDVSIEVVRGPSAERKNLLVRTEIAPTR